MPPNPFFNESFRLNGILTYWDGKNFDVTPIDDVEVNPEKLPIVLSGARTHSPGFLTRGQATIAAIAEREDLKVSITCGSRFAQAGDPTPPWTESKVVTFALKRNSRESFVCAMSDGAHEQHDRSNVVFQGTVTHSVVFTGLNDPPLPPPN